MNSWLRHHGFALGDAFRHLFKTPGNFLLNVLVVSIALALPFAGMTLLENVRPVSEQLAVEPEISVFMAMDTSRERATAIAPEIRRIAQEAKHPVKLEFIPREKALSTLKNKTGLDDAISTLGANPLPDAYVVKMTGFQNDGDAKKIKSIVEKLQALNGVEYVQMDSAWVERLAALLQVMRLILIFLATTLGVVVVAVVFNTIRLQVMTQREEIEVSRLVGATDSFICRPFYYTGALLGLIAGGVALIAVALALNPLNTAIADFARLYASEFRLAPLDLVPTLILLAASAFLGLLGALLSVQRHLARLH
ncbi:MULTISPECIES: permease-like cell division protein FtsX [Oxalobacteraceae]|uniref:Cell division protein FtsX n=1 Tax=Herminiimonas contaminans TaxID=1111140 RepID=A0ABS0ENS7_9BURK|nr:MULTISPECIES: permease-like cell division protein FtsX [Oxalobacteraceae]MBF8176511.1 ABC transporter permease [Herminiimonas contaminans]